jgi:hypothetical protein
MWLTGWNIRRFTEFVKHLVQEVLYTFPIILSNLGYRKKHCIIDVLADLKIGRLIGHELIRLTPKTAKFL